MPLSGKETSMFWRIGMILALALLVGPATLGPAWSQAAPFADPAFRRLWERADGPVADGRVVRSWLWGDAPFAGGYEAYADAPGGRRLVQYFDKARMEINNPAADPNGTFYVTNGLLVVEMLSGRLQTGDNSFAAHPPAALPVAGDGAAANPDAPTYAAFARVSTLAGSENQAADATGAPVTHAISKEGAVSVGDARGVRYAHYVAETRHNIADVFWRFMNQQGPADDAALSAYGVEAAVQILEGPLILWEYALGYPVSEPHWATVKIAGRDQPVLVQMFQRRVLTYNPANAPAWQVEMGNVGRHYADWRAGLGLPVASLPPGAPATPTAGPDRGAVLDWFRRTDAAMNALTAMKGRSVTNGVQNGTPIADYADYAWEAPDKFQIRVRSPRPGVSPDPVSEQIRIGNQFYQRVNNGPWDHVTTNDAYQWPTYNHVYLGEHADEALLEKQETVDGTPCQVIRVMIKNAQGEIDRYIHYYIATTDYTVRREVTEAQATAEHGAGASTTDFYDFNVPSNIAAP
jgi:hypothetical protein